jgi:probable HAF family extracellular repeat protein
MVVPPGAARADELYPISGLGTLGGDMSRAYGVSANGMVVAGESYITDNMASRAFSWTAAGRLNDLGALTDGANSKAWAVSANGDVFVGDSGTTGGYTHAVSWTGGVMTDIHTTGSFTGNNSAARAISGDGVVVAGLYEPTPNVATTHAFSWTQAGGLVDLHPTGYGNNSRADGMSSDSLVIVGSLELTSGGATHAAAWTGGVVTDLSTLGGDNSHAHAASFDGSVIVGKSEIAPGDSTHHAFRWTGGVMTDLSTLGGSNSTARALSANGGVVVGSSEIASGSAATHAFRWTQGTGMMDLNTLLRASRIDMTGITLASADGVSADGKYIVGTGSFPEYAEEAYLACYDPSSSCVGVTTAASQLASVQRLADTLRATAIQSRSTSNELLGLTRPIDNANYQQIGGMFGSALGYAAAQYSSRGVTLLGGVGYGSQDYPSGVSQDAGPTFAAAGRYAFVDRGGVRPYVEMGAWAAPQAAMTLTRTYANGAGWSEGHGDVPSTTWAEYGRGGLMLDVSPADRFTGFGEIGQQTVTYLGYAEAEGPNNPFSAVIDGGAFRMNVARGGASWTHHWDRSFWNLRSSDPYADPNQPAAVSLTLAGAVARSFATSTAITASVPGLGVVSAASQAATWCEFGARLEAQITRHMSIGLDLNGITGDAITSSIHGGVSLTYKF